MREQIIYGVKLLVPAAVFFAAVLCGHVDITAAEEYYDMGRVDVTAEGDKQEVVVEPQKSTILLENLQSADIPQNVGDIISDLVIMDFQGKTDLVPDDDTLYMRGFSSKRFVTSIDGMTVRKTGGRRSSHIVDYALIPPFLIESVDVLPGPHSALFPGKSIGGVVDFITREPLRHDKLKPDFTVSASYGSYATQNHSLTVQGGAGRFTYDLGYQKYATDGYLRSNEANIDTVFGRVGYILPNSGYVTFTASYAKADREIPVYNDPGDPESGYDDDYPMVSSASFYDWQSPTWDKEAPYYRLHLALPSPMGNWTATAYYGEESRDYSMLELVDSEDPSQGVRDGSWETEWRQQGGKIANEFQVAEGHVTTLGAELEQLYDGYGDTPGWGSSPAAHDEKKRVEIISGFAQHQWSIIPRLTLTAGLRYEDATIWVSNFSSQSGDLYITGRNNWIERSWSEWMPKSFLTYELDDHADWLRDTSISAGVSKIWRAPDYHGDYNPQGRPTGAWLEPEHGIGYDAVVNRRLFGSVNMRFNYAYYEIRDYIAGNRDYAEYWPRGPVTVEPGLEYLDYRINLEEVIRHGIEFHVNGDLTEKLRFLIGYAWQKFKNQGDEPAGETELDDRPEHRVTAGLTYNLFKNTRLILDYEYQDEQIVKVSRETAPDVYEFDEIAVDDYHVFDFAVEQILFDQWMGLRKGMLKIYVKNLLDEDYRNTSAYPATDRTIGAGIRFGF